MDFVLPVRDVVPHAEAFMGQLRRLAVPILGVLLLATAAPAATVPVPDASNDWQNISGFAQNADGVPYFDHRSWNIWTLLNDTVGIPDSELQFWGTTTGAPDTNMSFGPGDQTVQFTLQYEFAANSSINEFGWVDPSLGGNGFQSSDLNPIFVGSSTPGATTTVVLPDTFGLYLRNTVTGDVFLSLTGVSPTDASGQHFSVFRDIGAPSTLWIGVEDLRLKSGDKDYDDFVVSMTTTAPEPGTLLLLGSGLLAGAGYVRRRRRAPQVELIR
jgi:hypothetical protein